MKIFTILQSPTNFRSRRQSPIRGLKVFDLGNIFVIQLSTKSKNREVGFLMEILIGLNRVKSGDQTNRVKSGLRKIGS